jgi:rfaE bifunctional protein kinase chain/domain
MGAADRAGVALPAGTGAVEVEEADGAPSVRSAPALRNGKRERCKMREELLDAIEAWQGKPVVVLGDVILDEYLLGKATRLSREAPVPVLEYTRGFFRMGGAANPASNVVGLGGKALLLGAVGDDDSARELESLAGEIGVSTSFVTIPGRPTTRKTRIVAEGGLIFAQHLARIDRVSREPLPEESYREIVERLEKEIPSSEVLLISDYRNGVMSAELISDAMEIAWRHRVPVVVDAQGDLLRYEGAHLLKCNRHEAESEIGRRLVSDDDFAAASAELKSKLGAECIVITRGADGMTVAWGGSVDHLPPVNRSEVFDVTGAGDTVVAVLALAVAAGASFLTGATLANLAAGIAVSRLGNVVVRRKELEDLVKALG